MQKQADTIGHEVLEMVKLNERLDAYPSELSGGMMQTDCCCPRFSCRRQNPTFR